MKHLLLTLGLFAAFAASAQVPQIINYQGRITIGGTNYDATGLFKFALVNTAGTANYWANDGTASGQPATGGRCSRPGLPAPRRSQSSYCDQSSGLSSIMSPTTVASTPSTSTRPRRFGGFSAE